MNIEEIHPDEEEPYDYAWTLRNILRCFMWIHMFFFVKIILKAISKCRKTKEYHL
jgi:hypothetical protein